MELIGLFLFSVTMAIFGAYQVIPITNIRPTAEFPERLQSGFKCGYTFRTIGNLLNLIHPPEEPAPLFPAVTATPSITSSAIFESPSCSATSMALDSVEEQPTPYSAPSVIKVTSVVHTTVVVTSIIEVHKGPNVRGLPDWLLGCFDMALLLAEELGRLAGLVTMPRIDVHVFLRVLVFAVYTGAILIVLAAAYLIISCAYLAYRRTSLDFARQLEVANRDVNALSTEIERETALIMEKLRGRNQAIPRAMARIASIVEDEEKTMLDRVASQRTKFDQLEAMLALKRDQLSAMSRNIQAQFTPFPTREALLGDVDKKFNDILDGARAKLDEEVAKLDEELAKLKSLIPDFMKKFDSTVASLRRNKIDSLSGILEKERQEIQSEIVATQKLREQLPTLANDLEILRDEADEARSEVSGVGAKIKKINERNEESFFKVQKLERVNKDLQEKLTALEGQMTDLEEQLVCYRLALKVIEAGETEDTTSPDKPDESLDELPREDPGSGSDAQTAILVTDNSARDDESNGESDSTDNEAALLERELLEMIDGPDEEGSDDDTGSGGVKMAPGIVFGSGIERGRTDFPHTTNYHSPVSSPDYTQS